MKCLNNHDLRVVVGASKDVSASFELDLDKITMEKLPLIALLVEDCVNYEWDITECTSKMVSVGIDPKQISINANIHFYSSFSDKD